jgi:ABC-type molybdate transport system substrate-binding protein
VAVIRPVLIVKRTTQESLRQEGKPVTGLNDLLRPDLKVVLANPKLASIGQLAQQVLEPLGIWGPLQQGLQDRSARVSTVGTVLEVLQIVRTRDDHLGIVWDANALQFKDVEVIPVPEFQSVSGLVQIGVLKKSRDPTAALQFARYLTARDKGEAIFARYGYAAVDDADFWEETPTLHLAAGAMLKPALDDVVKAFAEREGVTVNTSYAGCGLLVAQMEALKKGQTPGRFPDAYFACDTSFLEQVQHWFEPSTLVAKNDIVLIVQRGNPKSVRSLADLARPELRVGLCHPTKSALGKLTDDLLRRLGLYEAVYPPDKPGRVLETDAAHLLVNQMRAGALDLAVVYRSNVLSTPVNAEKFLDIIEAEVPGALASQPLAIAKETRHRYLAERLRQAILAPESAKRFQALGFHWEYEAPR